MKKLILLLVVVIMSMATTAHAFIDSYTIDRDKLPEDARTMLEEHFPKAKVSSIKIDRHLLKKPNYDVKLTNGTTIEFSNKGKWKSVDCKKRAVPEQLVPKAIRSYVAKNHDDAEIVSIRKRSAGYDIGLSNDTTLLRFNLLGLPVK